MNSDKKHLVLSSNMFVSVLNFLCIPQIGRLPAHGPNAKRLLIPRSVLLSGLLRIEEIEKTFFDGNVNNDEILKVLRMGLYSGKGSHARWYHFTFRPLENRRNQKDVFDEHLEVDAVVREKMVVTTGHAIPARRIELSAHDPNLKRLPTPPIIFLWGR